MRYKQGRAYTPEAYANDAEYFKDVARAYQRELEVLYEAGLRNVQFDDPGLACECSLFVEPFVVSADDGVVRRLLLQAVPQRMGRGF